ncbi:bifunctional UDP-N-acetylglucosamine diphosphorylase/glucosamine-1-phosphate N-acetyltransferase GlmU [Anaerosphaera multitolerans]|uniref:Bifunctional protein GlmU n=1 Tax=Anaerosphaera multitolerans TaxID=2487351 RepID=A0A437S7R6_9FIRM|nr:bifunctional UDP-N-acetylglucosamine diphosphorylase/glucosamine-1-phosphate N-acetyltransferase GlmU [Anaerosphaera multitolerans]RVU55129.1 bifunctional UDP-N-acetylglucosamine diphosphorylase/glucosamine-1-phosphate N-acetyltransferase GlmU [Anaerosphaera multitolerans]
MKISIVLAAGEGTRMKSKTPKVLHEILGKPMLEYVIDSARESNIEKVSVIIGHGKEKINEYFQTKDVVFREQPMGEGIPYGTGFAVMQADGDYNDEDTVIILNGDTPLIESKTLDEFIKYHEQGNFSCTILTAEMENPYGYGRIVRDEDAKIYKIVEQKDANEKEKLIREINSGIFAFKGEDLRRTLKSLNTDNAQGELYLTDLIKTLFEEGKRVGGYRLRNNSEILGVNSRDHLSKCTEIMRDRVNRYYMLEGVTLIDPKSVIIESSVKIGRDTVIYPGAILQGSTEIGENCTIYGTTRIVNSKIGDNTTIDNALIEDSTVGDSTKIGPYAHLRPKANVGDNVKIGNFVEVKNSNFGNGSKAGHLAYIGDADVGENVNVGCGVIFVNYDGKGKHRTEVGDNAFLGSNANLVAPVKVEEYGYIAAGSTITKDVLEGQLSVERAKQRNVDGWVEKKGLK